MQREGCHRPLLGAAPASNETGKRSSTIRDSPRLLRGRPRPSRPTENDRRRSSRQSGSASYGVQSKRPMATIIDLKGSSGPPPTTSPSIQRTARSPENTRQSTVIAVRIKSDSELLVKQMRVAICGEERRSASPVSAGTHARTRARPHRLRAREARTHTDADRLANPAADGCGRPFGTRE